VCFGSRDNKDGGHTIRSAIAEKPNAARKLLSSIEPELLPIVLHCENEEIRVGCYRDLDLDPMTFIYELDT